MYEDNLKLNKTLDPEAAQPAELTASSQENEQTIGIVGQQIREKNASSYKTKKEDSAIRIEKELKKNKTFFYGLPLVVLSYGLIIIFIFVVPSIQTFFATNDSIRKLNQNLENYRQTSENLSNARARSAEYDAYVISLTEYIPAEAQLGFLLNLIQERAGDFGLESKVGLPSADTVLRESTLNNIAARDQDDNSIFDSINSGEVDFTPNVALDSNATAKLLSVDVIIEGDRQSFLNFLESMQENKPIINLVFIEYKLGTEISESSNQTNNIRAVLRFESYSLRLDSDGRILTPVSANDPSLLFPVPIETFQVSSGVVEEFSE
jgi:hypothetical protein